MRRIILSLVVAALGAAAVALPEPDPPQEPLAGLVLDRPGLSSPVDESIWYCPWAQAETARDSDLATASIDDATAAFTFPVAIPGDPPDTASLSIAGPGVAALTLSDVARRGDSPFFVEFAGGPAAVSATVTGDGVLAADHCVASGPDVWYFPGGSTFADERLTLRIFNPFSEPAKVTVSAVSDVGVEALGEYRGISVSPRRWRDIVLEQELRQRETLVIAVSVEEGLVVPAMRFADDQDEGWWTGTGLATQWEFPITEFEGLEGELVVSNPGLAPVDVTVDILTAAGPRRDALTVTLPPDEPNRLVLTGTLGEPAGALVTATGPITAAVVARGELGVAVTSGLAERARTWLVPGARTTALESATVWLLNTSDEPVAVTVTALAAGPLVGERIVLDPGALLGYEADGPATGGYLVDAAEPISVAWSLTGASGAAFAAASPVSDE